MTAAKNKIPDIRAAQQHRPTSSSARLARLLAPPARYKISEFAEEKVFIPFKPEAGKYRLERMPWQREMLDDPLAASTNEVVWMMGRRLGKSICVCIITMFFIFVDPAPQLIVYPTIDAVKKWFKKQILKVIQATPCMNGLLRDPRAKDSDSTILDRFYPGGELTGIGANSPASLRSENKRVVMQEEVDAYEKTSEGDAVELADGRAENFPNAFKLKTSTPGNKGESRIEEIFDRSDKRYFFLPCAHCGKFFAPKRENLRFSFNTHLIPRGGSPRGPGEIRDTPNARLVCPHCEWELDDRERIAMIQDRTAHWKATEPFTGTIGRHLNGLYRIMGRKPASATYLHEFAEMWLKAKHGGQETTRVFINNFDAVTWEPAAIKVDWAPLMKWREQYFEASAELGQGPALPIWVMFITAGLDIHPDRVEVSVYGWGAKEECWGLEFDMIIGDFDQPEMQERVWEFLDKRYVHPWLGELKIKCCGVDTGYQTKEKAAYQFCWVHRNRNVWATKGSSNPLGGLWTKSDATKRYGIALYVLNTDTYKSTIFDRLESGMKQAEESAPGGPRYIHFHMGYTVKFFKMLCSERKMLITKGNSTVSRWVKHKSNTRNEALDCFVGAMGAYDIYRPGALIEKQWKKLLSEHPEQLALRPRKEMERGADGKKIYELQAPAGAAAGGNAERRGAEEPAKDAKPIPAKKGRGGASLPRRGNGPWRRGGFFNPLGL